MTEPEMDNIIERMIKEHNQLMEHLQPIGDISLQSRLNNAFAKTLLLSAASYFEDKITNSVIQVFQDSTNNSDALVSFVKNKAATRRYHEWFSWDAKNANRFFRAFGEGFIEAMNKN